MNLLGKKHLYLFALFTLFCLGLSAQITVSGTVFDADTKTPLPETNIYISGTNIGTTSDFDGKFSLKIDADSATLVFSSVGFVTQNLDITSSNNSDLTILMEADSNQLETVFVTANKTAQSSQKVPLSISVVGIKQLQRTGAKEFRDYAAGIPNLAFGTQGGDAGGRFSNEISIRGISGAKTTAVYLNDAPLPESISPNLIDVSRIEILKGPQGTLYGSSTMGGAVKIITNKPNVSETSGFIGVETSSVQEGSVNYGATGLVNIPLSDKLAFRGSGYFNYQSGVYDRVSNKDIEWLNEENPLTEDFYGDTEDWNGDPFNIVTDGCAGCSREDKKNIDSKTDIGYNANLGFYPTEDLSIIGTVIYQKLKGDGYDFAEGDVTNFIQHSNTGLDETFYDEWTNYSLGIEYQTNSGLLTLSSNYLDRRFIESEDTSDINAYWWIEYEKDFSEPLEYIWGGLTDRAVNTRLFQQEIRYNSDLKGKFNFVVGGFYSSEEVIHDWQDKRRGLTAYLLQDNVWDGEDPDYGWALWGEEDQYDRLLNGDADGSIPWYKYYGTFNNTEFALFGQFYYDLTTKLKFTLGLRYFNTTLKKDIDETGADFGFTNSPFKTEFSESGVNPKFNLTYQINKDKMIYANVSKGYRTGDSNELLPIFAQEEMVEEGLAWPSEFGSDYIWNYELGFKSISENGKFISNLAVFYNKWSNLQQYKLLDAGWGYTSNVGSAHSSGFELDLKGKLTKNFEVGLGLGILNPEIDEEDPTGALEAQKGDKILYAASFTANANAQYTIEFSDENSFYIRTDLQHVGERFGTYNPELEPELVFPEYTLVNARAGYVLEKYEFSIFCNNLTNKQAVFGNIQSFAGNLPGRERLSTNRPMTIGVNLKFNF